MYIEHVLPILRYNPLMQDWQSMAVPEQVAQGELQAKHWLVEV